MTVASILGQKGADVSTISPHADIKSAADWLHAKNIGALLVISDDAILGIISERDIVHAFSQLYEVIDGKVDARTYNGFRRYHASCNHCHGSDGLGSTFGPPLVDRLPEVERFRRIVLEGQRTGLSVMQGFGQDPNIVPYIDDIYAYLQARADGALGRGRPTRLGQ